MATIFDVDFDSIVFEGSQQLLAIGDSYGTLHVLEVPWVFRSGSSKEAQATMSYLKREKDRLEYMDTRRDGRLTEKRERDAKINHQRQVASGSRLLKSD